MNYVYCRNCGNPLPADSNYCNKCGARNDVPTPSTPYVQQPQQVPYYVVVNKPKVPGRGMGITALVLGICGLVYSFIMFTSALDFSFKSGMIPSIMMFLAVDILAISFAGVALSKGYRKTKTYWGLTLGIIGAVFAFLAMIV